MEDIPMGGIQGVFWMIETAQKGWVRDELGAKGDPERAPFWGKRGKKGFWGGSQADWWKDLKGGIRGKNPPPWVSGGFFNGKKKGTPKPQKGCREPRRPLRAPKKKFRCQNWWSFDGWKNLVGGPIDPVKGFSPGVFGSKRIFPKKRDSSLLCGGF